MSNLLLKKAYVRAMSGLRTGADKVGLLRALEGAQNRNALWVRSLFGIYHSDDLIHLDLPWWSFRAVDEVSAFLLSLGGKARVFEFGAGASTVWLARRAAEVVSVEHDVAFGESLRPRLVAYPNVRLSVIPPVPATGRAGEARSRRAGHENLAFDAYVGAITAEPGVFDLIVIDGRSRVACLEAAVGKLAAGGMILFDNSDRAEYRAGLEGCGLTVRRLRGLAPALPFPSETAVLTAKA